MNLMDIGECNGRRLYGTLDLSMIIDYRLRLWPRTSASRVVSAVAELSCLSAIAIANWLM